MNKILFKHLENGKNLYHLKKATDGSSGFDLLAAIQDTVIMSVGDKKWDIGEGGGYGILVKKSYN